MAKKEAGWSELRLNRARKRLTTFFADLPEDKTISKSTLPEWKLRLVESSLSPRTIDEYLAVANQFVEYAGFPECCMNKGRKLDLKGHRFGELTVLEQIKGKRSVERSLIWKCQCSCGKIVEIPANHLRKGMYTSCGCKKAERLKETNQYVEGTSLKMVFSDTVRRDNTSGFKGVYQKKDRWAARIQYKGKRYYLGSYDKLEDAVSIRKEAEEKIREDAKNIISYTDNAR